MWRKCCIALIRILLIIVMLMAAIYWMQDRLLHQPQAIEPATALVVARDLRLAPWPDAEATHGWLRETAATTRGTFVLFHGNGGHALQRGWFADEMEARGYRTLLAEFPGYGHRSGATDEQTLSTDAAEVIAAIRKSFGGPLIVAGESLGAAVAAAALAHGDSGVDDSGVSGVNAVLLITPWNNLAGVAAYHYPLLPTGLVLRDRYDSVANLKGFTGPKLVLLAAHDSIVPSALGRRLFEQLESHKKLLVVPDSDHNDWTYQMRPENWQEALTFLAGH